MLIVGLTGNYGMGKSAVLEIFGKLGARTVDADSIVEGLLDEPGVKEGLVQILGAGVLDESGAVNRAKVSDTIFRNESLRLEVEDLLHPLVFERTDEAIRQATEDVVVVEAALIFERCHSDRFHRTITVFTDEETAVSRLEKKGVRRDEAMRRLLWQMPAAEKARLSDYSIDNGGTKEETEAQVRRIYAELLEAAAVEDGGA